MSKVKHC